MLHLLLSNITSCNYLIKQKPHLSVTSLSELGLNEQYYDREVKKTARK